MTYKKISINIEDELLEKIQQERIELAGEIGFVPTLSHTIKYLVKKGLKK